ncbi:phiSA1p31-related protein [Streptomyces sp. IBSNAI001]|uniref:phiSA1p31-related protein n=1 Tax=Streptomyces sp. IBSNAI001 TaxID=3457499 RepID=UPI003FD030CE
MATAQYETRTRTVEETVVVLTLTEDEADELRTIVGLADGTRTTVRIYQALEKIEAPKPAPADDTFEYDGVTYDLDATYADKQGDTWTFTGNRHSNGSPALVCEYSGYTEIGDVLDSYGPLTKVTP